MSRLFCSVLFCSSGYGQANPATSISINANQNVINNNNGTYTVEYTGTVVLSNLETSFIGVSALLQREDAVNPPSFAGVVEYPHGLPGPGGGAKPIKITFFDLPTTLRLKSYSGTAEMFFLDANKVRNSKEAPLPKVTLK